MNGIELLLIGGSAGSLEVLMQLLPALDPALDIAIVLVMHRKNADSMLSHLLSERTQWPVKEAEEKEPVKKGTIYIAPADYHLLFEKDRTFSLDYSEKLHYSRPAIDASFETAAETYGSSLACLLLSGANSDGALGLLAVKDSGALTIVQDPEEASVSYMPRQGVETAAPEYILTTPAMIALINRANKRVISS
jgi:two-component system chemotaxis response regulator CheB